MCWLLARGITAVGRVIDGDWLGTAYFGQKTGDYFRKNMELQFFNHFLKDKGDISAIKEVNLFDTGSHEWRSFDNIRADKRDQKRHCI